MITLKEILKREEEQTTIPTELKKRLLENILKNVKKIKPNSNLMCYLSRTHNKRQICRKKIFKH